MEDKRKNIIFFCIMGILMIVAITIVIINPNKIEKTVEIHKETENNQEEDKKGINIMEINEQEERKLSMQTGGTFCKIGNQIIFYEDKNKTIYIHNLDENITNKLVTLEHDINKMYFDGENIYYIPSYYSTKGIYKVDLQGNIQKIYEDTSLQLLITEHEIYFVKQIGYDEINQNPQGTICYMNKEGENVIEIVENVKNYFFLENDKIYYTSQDREMYSINKDGSEKTELVQGRKFVIDVSENYLLYRDYSNQEAIHIFDLDTKEDSIIGQFGMLRKYEGRTYINARERLEDGSIEDEFTLFEVLKNNKIKEIGKIANFGTDLKYISNNKAYIYSQQEGIYTINLENNQKESAEQYNKCRYFLGGYGYKIDDTDLENIIIDRIEIQ